MTFLASFPRMTLVWHEACYEMPFWIENRSSSLVDRMGGGDQQSPPLPTGCAAQIPKRGAGQNFWLKWSLKNMNMYSTLRKQKIRIALDSMQ